MANEKTNSEEAFRAEFAERIKTTPVDQLPSLIREMLDRPHDYGTIVVATGMAAAAAAWAVNRDEKGGLTGFQAGCVSWEFLRGWGALCPGKLGGRMQDFGDLLYPQYEHKFRSIPASVLEGLRSAATANLADADRVHPDVAAHWRRLSDGHVPFGLSVEAA